MNHMLPIPQLGKIIIFLLDLFINYSHIFYFVYFPHRIVVVFLTLLNAQFFNFTLYFKNNFKE